MGVDHIPVVVDTMAFQPLQDFVVFPVAGPQALDFFFRKVCVDFFATDAQIDRAVIPFPENQSRHVEIALFTEEDAIDIKNYLFHLQSTLH